MPNKTPEKADCVHNNFVKAQYQMKGRLPLQNGKFSRTPLVLWFWYQVTVTKVRLHNDCIGRNRIRYHFYIQYLHFIIAPRSETDIENWSALETKNCAVFSPHLTCYTFQILLPSTKQFPLFSQGIRAETWQTKQHGIIHFARPSLPFMLRG